MYQHCTDLIENQWQPVKKKNKLKMSCDALGNGQEEESIYTDKTQTPGLCLKIPLLIDNNLKCMTAIVNKSCGNLVWVCECQKAGQ